MLWAVRNSWQFKSPGGALPLAGFRISARLFGLSSRQAADTVATATSLAGALWQMATPGPEIAALYRSEPQLAHAIVDVEAGLTRILAALITGCLAEKGKRKPG